jgi:hypothetical protein
MKINFVTLEFEIIEKSKELEEYEKNNKEKVDWDWKKQFEKFKIPATDQEKILFLYKKDFLDDKNFQKLCSQKHHHKWL